MPKAHSKAGGYGRSDWAGAVLYQQAGPVGAKP